ncbi:MAG: hypothetical protein HY765_02400 [Rhodomicrobium sp.]|nr:hypothetical protein [Rhodomicrobium sp.]
MRGENLEPAFLKEARHASEHGVVAPFEKPEYLRQMTEKTCIGLDPEEVRPAQASGKNDARAALPAQDAQQAAKLSDMHIGVGKTLDARPGVSGQPSDEGVVASSCSILGNRDGECSASSDDADPCPRACSRVNTGLAC